LKSCEIKLAIYMSANEKLRYSVQITNWDSEKKSSRRWDVFILKVPRQRFRAAPWRPPPPDTPLTTIKTETETTLLSWRYQRTVNICQRRSGSECLSYVTAWQHLLLVSYDITCIAFDVALHSTLHSRGVPLTMCLPHNSSCDTAQSSDTDRWQLTGI